MDMSLDRDLLETLRTIVEADTGAQIVPYFSGEHPDLAGLGIADEHGEEVFAEEGHVVRLAGAGYLDMDPIPQGRRLASFRVTDTARELIASMSRSNPGTPIDLSWELMTRLIAAVHEMWLEDGAPQLGVDIHGIGDRYPEFANPEALEVQLRELERQDWIDCRYSLGSGLPWGVRPSDQGLAMAAGWPTGDPLIAAQALIERVGAKLDEIPDAEERSNKKKAFSQINGVVRDLAVDVVAGVIAKQSGLD